MIVSIIARVLEAALTIYMLACAIRIFLTWLPRRDLEGWTRFLAAAVDPWLGFFSRFRLLHVGAFDFSPIAALAVLTVAIQVLATLPTAGAVTLGALLALLLAALWSAVAFVLTFLCVVALVRLIAYAARWNSLHPLWRVVDDMLNPFLFRITRIVYGARIVNYLRGLATGFVILLAARIAGELLVGLLAGLLRGLPI